MGQTATMQTSQDNAAFEPQEQNASMGTENDMGEGNMNMDPGMEEMDMGGGDMDPSMSGTDGNMGTDPSMGQPPVKDVFKKRKLFKDYKDLLTVIENLEDISSNVLAKDLPEDAKKIYNFITHKMEENKEKIVIIMTEQYLNLSYQQLLTIYMYLKMATKLYSDMLKQLNDAYNEKS